MSWEKVRLGDIAEFSNGINFGKDDYGKGIKIIGVSNFGDKFSPEYDSLTEVNTISQYMKEMLGDGIE